MRVCLIASLVADHQSLIANTQSRSSTHTAPPKTPSLTFTDQALTPVYVVGGPALTSVVEVVEAGVTLVLVTIMVPAVVVVLGALGGWTMYEDQNVAAVVKTSDHLQHEKALPCAHVNSILRYPNCTLFASRKWKGGTSYTRTFKCGFFSLFIFSLIPLLPSHYQLSHHC